MVHKIAGDPRTVARNIPGVFESIFPQLTPSVVAYFNRTAVSTQFSPVPIELVQKSKLQKAMLFELGFAVGEQLLAGNEIDWEDSLTTAIARQKSHFDARIPNEIAVLDQQIAEMVGRNILRMVSELAAGHDYSITVAPAVPGFQWISSGNGDFAMGPLLIEVKCINGHFSASDYRQLVMYWLLNFAASIESGCSEWSAGVLLNPRSAKYVQLQFDNFLNVISGGRTKVEILQHFSSMVGTRDWK